ncbi:MAG: PEP-CTERM sorting domain-containing protein [Armatimonadetes bacterium]|nr:PEP-CTERM sorting domain-containing protein [Armatimonadota bacterium]
MLKQALIIGLAFGAFAAANAVTIATHQDPALNGSTPLFFVTPGANGSVTGSWTGNGLTLDVPVVSQSFNNVKMQMNSVTKTGNTLGAGSVVFYTTNVANPLFQIDFNSATIFQPFGLGGSYIEGNNVTFSGSAVNGLQFQNAQFAFSFANPVQTPNGNTYTASFTSSADVVPEPATMAVAGLALAALAKRKRK